MKLVSGRFKANKITIMLSKSLWLLAYVCSKSRRTNPLKNNPYRVIKHKAPLLSQSLQDTNCPVLTVFPCSHCQQQDRGVDKPTGLECLFLCFYLLLLLQKKISHGITRFARYVRHIPYIEIITIKNNINQNYT